MPAVVKDEASGVKRIKGAPKESEQLKWQNLIATEQSRATRHNRVKLSGDEKVLIYAP